MFYVVEREENRQKEMITGISFFSKWPFHDAHLFFKKSLAKTPIFIVFWGCTFLAKLSKGTFWTATKQKNKVTDN